MTNARMKRKFEFARITRCSNRPKGLGEHGRREISDRQASSMPRRCKQDAPTGRSGNAGAAPKWERNGGGVTLLQDGRRGHLTEAPRSHKTAGWA